MIPVLEQDCACSDCEAAVSPAAYLAELLDVALKRVRNLKTKIDLPFLVGRLHQPVRRPAHQLRRGRAIGPAGPHRRRGDARRCRRASASRCKEQALATAESAHAFAAYVMLLNRLGSSYEEVRRLRVANEPDCRVAADRLGVDLVGLRPDDTLDDSSSTPTRRRPGPTC